MKKYLAVLGALVGSFAAVPAHAQIDVTVGGYTSNYVGWADQDTTAGTDVKSVDILRDSELHFRAEGKTDAGLTYGFLVEALVDSGAADDFTVQESYLYLSNEYGKVILGSEDGASYALQVAAPSADSNIDGMRQYINPLNYGATSIGAGTFLSTGVDYAARSTGKAEKVTYMTPKWSGLQLGVSYTPDVGSPNGAGTSGFALDQVGLDEAYEVGVRYQGEANNLKYKVGAGYAHIEQGTAGAANDDVKQWNVGIDLDIGAFGIGAVYTDTENNLGAAVGDNQTYAVGVDYALTEDVKLGASYFNGDYGVAAGDIEVDRYTAGVSYSFVEGVSLRGSISHIQHEVPAAADVDGTSVMGGFVMNF